MKTSTQNHLAVLLALPMLSGSIIQAQLIVNGNFDLEVPRNGTGGGWTSAHNDGSGGWFSGGGSHGGTFILNEGGDPATDPTISQLVSGLDPGKAYLLTGEYASVYGGSGNPSVRSFAIDVDGINKATLGRPGGEDVYGRFSVSLIANDGDVLIAFRAEIDGDDSSFRIDNIALTPLVDLCTYLTIQVADIQICWPSESNRLYQLEYRSDLTTNMWVPLGSPVAGTGSNYCSLDSVLGQPQRSYRVQCVTNQMAR